MKHGSLFSGIGGFDLAAEWMGWENIFHCEWNPFGQKVLKHYWPNAESFTDITKTDFRKYANRIDVLTGGFPCQPYSAAGKRKGKEDERHLWPEMLRAIREIQPRYVVGENVRGLTSWNGGMVFDEVQADLEAQGYEVLPFLLPACAVNAPHRRDRIWFVAYSASNGHQLRRLKEGRCEACQSESLEKEREWIWYDGGRISEQRITSDTDISTKGSSRARGCITCNGSRNNTQQEERRTKTEQYIRYVNVSEDATNPGLLGQEKCEKQAAGIKQCDKGNVANTNSGRQPGKEYRKAKSGRFTETSFPNYWQNFPTQPPICGRNDGISSELVGITFSKHRNESIKAYGNAIVPQIALQIFKAIQQYENNLIIQNPFTL